MIKPHYILLVISCLLFNSCSTKAQDVSIPITGKLKPQPQSPEIVQMVTIFLESNAFRKIQLNDQTSENLYNEFLENVDETKVYFTQKEISEFEKYKLKLDDALKQQNVDFAYFVYNKYLENAQKFIAKVPELLKDSIDFSIKEKLVIEPEIATWAKDEKELNDKWRKRIKYEALSLVSAGKSWKNTKEEIIKRYTNYEKQLNKIKDQDVFDIYMNSFSGLTDPHTNYFSPRQAEDFNISSSLSLEGIGATLGIEGEYTQIKDVVKGGPADKSGKIFKDDKIMAVAQGKDGEFEDILGWRIDDVVQKIRGPKGTIVRLKIIDRKSAPGDEPKEVTIVREKIKLEDQAAKGTIEYQEKDGKKVAIGHIVLPSFYFDFEAARRGDADFKSTTNDLKKIIDSLKTAGIQGLILDLRNNGGGSLTEAINATGLFINKGPVVQIKDVAGKVEVENDEESGVAWDGPLAVLVNRFSASASEILAAALQDYGRAVIIGEKTHGKGTVQNVYDLDRWGKSEIKKGELKLTIAKFYRVNGKSTQVKGVTPDILFPGMFDAKEFGEDADTYHLPYDEIKSADYSQENNKHYDLAFLIKEHDKRIKSNMAYEALLKEIKAFQEAREKESVSLNYEDFNAQKKEQDERNKQKDQIKEKAKKENKLYPDDLILYEAEQTILDILGTKK